MERNDYAKVREANDKEILDALAKAKTVTDRVEEQLRGLRLRKKELDRANRDAFDARDRRKPVYLLKDEPFVTAEPPDTQQDLEMKPPGDDARTGKD